MLTASFAALWRASNGKVTLEVLPAARTYCLLVVRLSSVAVIVPAHPPTPAEQARTTFTAPFERSASPGRLSAAGVATVEVLVVVVGKVTPVALFLPRGSKQPSNSKTGLLASLPRLSVMVASPMILDG